MRVVRGLARLLLFTGATMLLLAGCGATGAPETEPAAAPPPTEGGDSAMLSLTSSAFVDGSALPVRFCRTGVSGGQNVSIPLTWTGAPAGTRSFAVVMIDRHPVANAWVHWVVVDLPASATGLPEGASGTGMPAGSRELKNTFGEPGYGGPQPPAGSGDHDYEIAVYALSTDHVTIGDRPSAADIERALAGQVLASATITGTFGR